MFANKPAKASRTGCLLRSGCASGGVQQFAHIRALSLNIPPSANQSTICWRKGNVSKSSASFGRKPRPRCTHIAQVLSDYEQRLIRMFGRKRKHRRSWSSTGFRELARTDKPEPLPLPLSQSTRPHNRPSTQTVVTLFRGGRPVTEAHFCERVARALDPADAGPVDADRKAAEH